MAAKEKHKLPENNDTTDIAGKNAFIENVALKANIVDLEAKLDTVVKSLARANDTLEQLERAKMIPIVKAHTNLPDADIMVMDTKAMFDLVETLRTVKLPTERGVSVKPSGLSEDAAPNFTVPDRFAYRPKGGK